MKRINKLILILFISVIPLFFGMFTILKAPRLISPMESRRTATFSNFIKSGVSRDMSANFEDALADQIPLRDKFIELNTKVELSVGKNIINDILVDTRHGFLVHLPDDLSDVNVAKNKIDLNDVRNNLNEVKIPFVYIDLPHKYDAYRQYIPNYYYDRRVLGYDIASIVGDENYLDMTKAILKNGTKNYYTTDHHINMNGIYTVYGRVIQYLNDNVFEVGSAKSKNEFSIKTYDDVFIGSDGRKATKSSVVNPDSIEIYEPKTNFDVSAELYSSGQEADVFQLSRINYDDIYDNDYAVYIGGDNNLCIYNRQSLTNKHLMIIGNSYDNSLVPLLSTHFSKVCHFDYRDIDDALTGKLNEVDPDFVILMQDYNMLNRKDAFTLLKNILE